MNMTDREPYAEDGKPARMPAWVKAFVIAGVLILAFVALHLAGLSPTGHGP